MERGTRIELHPLARVFLDERTQVGGRSGPRAAEACFRVYRDRKDWDAAFELIKRAQLTELLDVLVAASLDDLLETARLSTLEAWCRLASEADVESAITRLAQAEVRLRDGHLLEATAYAEMAAVDPELAFRALSIAGRAAHLASREEAGLALFQRAEEVAANEDQRRDAKWGQLACSIDLEHQDAVDALDQLSAGVSFADVTRTCANGDTPHLPPASYRLVATR